MRRVHGVITDRLVRLFESDDPAWTPQRVPVTRRMPDCGCYGGALGGKPGRKAKH